MERYKNLIHNSINAFISNYLIDGQLMGINGFDDISAFLHEKYPYMSIAYMLNINSLQDDYEKFIDEYKREIEIEIISLESLFGIFFRYSHIFREKENLITQLKDKNAQLSEEVNRLKHELSLKTITINEPTTQLLDNEREESGPHIEPEDNINTDIDRFMSDIIEPVGHFVDLGNGTFWGCNNFGAKMKSEKGSLYSSPVYNSSYNEINHLLINLNQNFCKTVDYEFDIPTFDDCLKLLRICKWKESSYGDKFGILGTSSINERELFFPYNRNYNGKNAVILWSRAKANQFGEYKGKGRTLELFKDHQNIGYRFLPNLFPIRLVIKKKRIVY